MKPRSLGTGIVCWSLMAMMFWAAKVPAAERIPILIDTDMGASIDDAFALGLALGSHELELRGITTVGGDTKQKGMLLCRFLTVTGRRNTRVAVGSEPQPDRPLTNLHPYYYHPDALFNRTTKPDERPAVEFLRQRLQEQPGKITLVALGPLTNIARLLETEPEAKALPERIILLETNIGLDIPAARKVFASGVPLVVIKSDASRNLMLDEKSVNAVFRPGTALSRQIEALYQMWDQSNPPLAETLAVALCLEESWCTFEKHSLAVDDEGQLRANQSEPNARVLTAVQNEPFQNWYTQRMAALVKPADRPSRVFEDDKLPYRVHVAEDFDNEIERRWWMSGKPELKVLPPESRRACRGVLTHDFDDLLMASREMHTAVIFNPVPGPPMGKNTRLSFRYWLKGTDTVRVQIYSLTNGYHRHLVVSGLPQETWRRVSVDMTDARRPDGTGGPLSENERIDDIQFYIDPNAELVIDDIVLYDAAPEDEARNFPRRIVFAGCFDTGQQGEHWPGDFEIVPDAGNFWKAAHCVTNKVSGQPWIRLHLRGERKLGDKTQLSFRYRLQDAEQLQVKLHHAKTGASRIVEMNGLKSDEWSRTMIEFDTAELPLLDEIHFLPSGGADLLVDDVLLFEPG